MDMLAPGGSMVTYGAMSRKSLSDVRKAVEKAQEEFRSGKVVLSMDCA